jgi:hypothetical protein
MDPVGNRVLAFADMGCQLRLLHAVFNEQVPEVFTEMVHNLWIKLLQ